MEGFKALPYIFLALAVAAIIGGATSITLGEFGNSVTQCFNATYTYNSTNDLCEIQPSHSSANNASVGNRNFTGTYFTIWTGQDSTLTVASQLSTVGIIGMMVVIIGLLAGVFVYFKYMS